jgi:hypothetical protein
MNITEIKPSKEEMKNHIIKQFNDFFEKSGFYDVVLNYKGEEKHYISFTIKNSSISFFEWKLL